jgi:dCMP deaminase
MPRIEIETVYMQVAYQFAQLSYAMRRKVGCIIVKENQVISFGYNGMPYGFNNICEDNTHSNCTIEHEHPEMTTTTKREVLHAESNAITKVAKSTMSCDMAQLYTTTCPCFDCAKLIIQAGIVSVYYTEDYRDMSGVELLKAAGIPVEKISVTDEY